MAIFHALRSGRMWPCPTLFGQAKYGHVRGFEVRQNVAIPDSLRSDRMWLYPTLCGQTEYGYIRLFEVRENVAYPTLCGQGECGYTRHFAVRQNAAIFHALRPGRMWPYRTLCGPALRVTRSLHVSTPKPPPAFVCVCVCVTGACWGREKEEAGTTTTSDLPRASECAWGAKQRSAQEPREWRRWG